MCKQKTILIVLILIQSGTGLYFDIGVTENKCFFQEIPNETTNVTVKYKTEFYDPGTKAYVPTYPSIGMLVKIKNSNYEIIHNYGSEGKLYLSTPGEHLICLSFNSTELVIELRVHLEIDVRESKEIFKLEPRLRRFIHRVDRIIEKINYLRERSKRSMETLASTQRRILFWICIQLVILLTMAAWQISYLKKIFQVEKLNGIIGMGDGNDVEIPRMETLDVKNLSNLITVNNNKIQDQCSNK